MVRKENEKAVSILSYFLVGIIWYFVDENVRKSKIAKFHVKQALNLMIVSIILGILLNIIIVVTFGLLYFVYIIAELILFVLWIIGLINAVNMKQKNIPIIGDFANKYLTF